MEKAKYTNITALKKVLEFECINEDLELVEKINKMINSFEKKNGNLVDENGNKILSPTQKLNEEIKRVIVEVLKRYTDYKSIKELQTENSELGFDKYSNQKLSSLIKQLIEAGQVERVEEKRVAKFKLINE
ncbi:MAG: hypothetical protein HUJ97_09025 [Bacteroidales bacterium]|nr:hypothetical protein [Clostridia bacterium]MCF0180365.1 hypothetical protein [Bacteroidales bacterium]